MHKLCKIGTQANIQLREYVLDSVDDLADLPDDDPFGSVAIVIGTSEVYIKASDGTWTKIMTGGGGGGYDPNAVKYTAQTKTDEEKTQARINIGATSADDVDDAVGGAVGELRGELKSVSFTGQYSSLSGKPESLKNPNSLTFGSDSYDGSEAKEITPSSIGLGSVFDLRGTVETVDMLPSTGNKIGDVYYVSDESVGYVWINDGTVRWEQLGLPIDMSSYYTKTETNGLLSTKEDKTIYIDGTPTDITFARLNLTYNGTSVTGGQIGAWLLAGKSVIIRVIGGTDIYVYLYCQMAFDSPYFFGIVSGIGGAEYPLLGVGQIGEEATYSDPVYYNIHTDANTVTGVGVPYKIAEVSALPQSPDANTIYLVTGE